MGPEGTKAETKHVWWPDGKRKRAARIYMRDEGKGKAAIGEIVASEGWDELRSTAATVRGGKREWGGIGGWGTKTQTGESGMGGARATRRAGSTGDQPGAECCRRAWTAVQHPPSRRSAAPPAPDGGKVGGGGENVGVGGQGMSGARRSEGARVVSLCVSPCPRRTCTSQPRATYLLGQRLGANGRRRWPHRALFHAAAA